MNQLEAEAARRFRLQRCSVNRNATGRAPRTEEERLLRGRLVGRTVQLIDGRSGVLQSVWYESATRRLACLIRLERVATWVDSSEIRIGPRDGTSRGPVA